MRQANLSSSLRRRRGRDPMREFDALAPPLRKWLTQARLPWSPRSARRIWERALSRSRGDPSVALALLDRAETRTLARDIAQTWGADHPETAPAVRA